MHACNLGDPCIPIDREDEDGGDEMTQDMKTLFRLAKRGVRHRLDQQAADLFVG